MTNTPPVIVLRLVTRPDAVPMPIRLRRALKALDRAYGFRCVSVDQEQPKVSDDRPDRTT